MWQMHTRSYTILKKSKFTKVLSSQSSTDWGDSTKQQWIQCDQRSKIKLIFNAISMGGKKNLVMVSNFRKLKATFSLVSVTLDTTAPHQTRSIL